MKTLTIGKILNNYKEFLTDYEIEQLRKVQRTRTDFSTQVRELKGALFGEEWDFMAREIGDPENFMSEEYTTRVNKKRDAFGVSLHYDGGTASEKIKTLFHRADHAVY